MEGDTLNLTFIYGTTTRHVNKETLDTERSVLPARLKFVLYQLDTLQLSQPQLNPNSTQKLGCSRLLLNQWLLLKPLQTKGGKSHF